MEINAFTKGKEKARTPNHNKKPLSCFNCGKPGHMTKECKIPSTRCTKCNWSRGGHKLQWSKASKIQTTTEEPTISWDQESRAIQGMSFDENKGKAKVL